MFSAIHPTTDIAKILRHVRFVPEAGIRLILSEMPDAQVAPYEQIGQTLRCIKDCQVTKVG